MKAFRAYFELLGSLVAGTPTSPIKAFVLNFGDDETTSIELIPSTIDKNDDVSSFDAGVRVYFTPVDGLEVTGFAMVDSPVGDDAGDDTGLTFGLESVFSF